MQSSNNSNSIPHAEMLQILANLFAQRSSFYAQIILADLQTLPSLKASLVQNLDSQPVAKLSPIVLNNNNILEHNNLASSNGNGHSNRNGNSNQNSVQQITAPTSISAPIQQQNQVTPKPKTVNTEDILINLVVQQTGYPQESITPDLKLLDDLNLDSIKAGELVANAAKECGVGGEIEPSTLANASLEDVATAIRAQMPVVETPQPTKINSSPKVVSHPQTVEKTTNNSNSDWVRNFAVEYVSNGR